MSRASQSPPDRPHAQRSGRQIIFEFTRVGDQTKVCVVDAASGTEATVFGPSSAARADLERLALNKLRYVMGEGREAPDAISADGRPGKLV